MSEQASAQAWPQFAPTPRSGLAETSQSFGFALGDLSTKRRSPTPSSRSSSSSDATRPDKAPFKPAMTFSARTRSAYWSSPSKSAIFVGINQHVAYQRQPTVGGLSDRSCHDTALFSGFQEIGKNSSFPAKSEKSPARQARTGRAGARQSGAALNPLRDSYIAAAGWPVKRRSAHLGRPAPVPWL